MSLYQTMVDVVNFEQVQLEDQTVTANLSTTISSVLSSIYSNAATSLTYYADQVEKANSSDVNAAMTEFNEVSTEWQSEEQLCTNDLSGTTTQEQTVATDQQMTTSFASDMLDLLQYCASKLG